MLFGYRAGVLVPSLLLAVTLTAVTPRDARSCRPAEALYSARALRRMRAYLELRVLELREARLERVRAVILRRLPIDELFAPQSHTVPGNHAIDKKLPRQRQTTRGCGSSASPMLGGIPWWQIPSARNRTI